MRIRCFHITCLQLLRSGWLQLPEEGSKHYNIRKMCHTLLLYFMSCSCTSNRKAHQWHRAVGTQADEQRRGQLLFLLFRLRGRYRNGSLAVWVVSFSRLVGWPQWTGNLNLSCCLLQRFPLRQVALLSPHPLHTIQLQSCRSEEKMKRVLNQTYTYTNTL